MMTTLISGMIATSLLTGLGLLHVYWAAGGKFGAAVAIPETNGRAAFVPGTLATLAVALALLVAAGIVMGKSGGLKPTWIFRWGTWGLAAVFLLRAIGEFRLVGFFKSVRNTRFAWWDTRLFSPLCLLLCVLLIVVAGS